MLGVVYSTKSIRPYSPIWRLKVALKDLFDLSGKTALIGGCLESGSQW